MSEGLGPLPERRIRHVYNESKGYECDCWMEIDVRAYAAAAVAAERERCLRIVRSVNNSDNPLTANDCADLIASGR